MLVLDNIDFADETLTGCGTIHYTNGILVQLPNESEVQSSDRPMVRRRQRSFHAPETEIKPFHQKRKICPSHISAMIPSSNTCTHLYNIEDLILAGMRELCSHPDSEPPSWSEFHRQLQTTTLPKSLIHYLPVIEAPPTEMQTVTHILKSVWQWVIVLSYGNHGSF